LKKNDKWLKLTVLLVALMHMPINAMGPVIQNIVENVFTDRSLVEVQTAFSFTNFVAPVVAIIAAWFITHGYLSKKVALVSGLCTLGLSALSIILLHSSFWHLYLSSILLGIATGLFVSNNFGLLFDNFDPAEREVVAGIQTSFVNGGGILLSLLGGILGSMIWYGGFFLLLMGFPLAILALCTVPHYKISAPKGEKKKLNPRVFYYCGIVFIFMIFYVSCGQNISTHIAAGGMAEKGFFGRSMPASTMSGIATAVQMFGGVAIGFVFGKISAKLKDFVIVLALGLMFVGFGLMSLFPQSYLVTLLSVLIVGTSISFTMPRCVYAVSTLVDPTNSATATSLITSLAPSLGGFLSPIVITNITPALFGTSTVSRYRFVGFLALLLAAVVAAITVSRGRKGTNVAQ